MNYKNRSIEKTLEKMIGVYPVIAITGPRQVGKTTLLEFFKKNSEQKIHYVTLDDFLWRTQANEDPELFLRNHETPLIIDEFQYAPNLLSYLKMNVDEMRNQYMFDNNAKRSTMYYLTGSQVFSTMKYLSDSLAGRIAILDLYGFSFREILGLEETEFIPDISILRKKEKAGRLSIPDLFEHILNGSYPELCSNTSIQREIFYQSYVKTYIERDVREFIKIKDENKFYKFLCALAARSGCEFNSSDIANDIEIDSKTVNEWLSILVNTHLIYLLNSYSNNQVQKVIKRPKVYFMDTGLACFLAGYFTSETLEKSPFSGNIFETYVITEIIKSYTNNGIDPHHRLYYYRDKNKKEIDLIILHDKILYPIEIKKSANPGKEAFKNFNVCEKFGYTVGSGVVLCMAKEIVEVSQNNYLVPIEYI